jgi:hypothetical protein
MIDLVNPSCLVCPSNVLFGSLLLRCVRAQ